MDKGSSDKQISITGSGSRKNLRFILVFVILLALIFFLLVLNVNTGNVPISFSRMLQLIFGGEGTSKELNILYKIRLPRVLMAAVLGGALSLSGFLLQTFFANPIAGPFVLGISSASKMVVAFTLVYFLGIFRRVSSFALVLAAFVGAMIATMFILLISKFTRNMAALLVGGIMVSYICSAITDFIVTFADDADIVNLHGWSQGSFSGMDMKNVGTASLIVGAALILTFLLAKPIGAYQLGEHYAQSVGVNVKRFRVFLILLSGILSASVAAFAGPISFIGIAVPFLIKRSLGTARPLLVIPAAFLGGAVFCMFSDLIARMAFAPTELSISTVTSLLGAPIVIYMLIQRRRSR